MTAPAKTPRQMRCACCGHTKPRKGCKTVAGTGLVCADCAPEHLAALSAIETKGARDGSPATGPAMRTLEPGRITPPGRATNVAALLCGATRDDGSPQAAMPPGVKVTVRPTPLGRFEVDPAAVAPLFSALGPGRYLPEGEAA